MSFEKVPTFRTLLPIKEILLHSGRRYNDKGYSGSIIFDNDDKSLRFSPIITKNMKTIFGDGIYRPYFRLLEKMREGYEYVDESKNHYFCEWWFVPAVDKFLEKDLFEL